MIFRQIAAYALQKCNGRVDDAINFVVDNSLFAEGQEGRLDLLQQEELNEPVDQPDAALDFTDEPLSEVEEPIAPLTDLTESEPLLPPQPQPQPQPQSQSQPLIDDADDDQNYEQVQLMVGMGIDR